MSAVGGGEEEAELAPLAVAAEGEALAVAHPAPHAGALQAFHLELRPDGLVLAECLARS